MQVTATSGVFSCVHLFFQLELPRIVSAMMEVLSLSRGETIASYCKYTLHLEPSQKKIKKAGDIQILTGNGDSIYK